MNIRTIALASLVVPVLACGSGQDLSDELTSDELIAALPTADMLTIPFPGTSTDASKMSMSYKGDVDGDASCEAAGDDESARFYTKSCKVAGFVNGVVDDVLTLISNITSHDPTHTDYNVYAWGPHDTDDGFTALFVMQRNDDGTISYRLMGKPIGASDDDYLTLIEGGIEDGVSIEENVGSFRIDYDNISALKEDSTAAGSAEYDYDRYGTQTGVTAWIEDMIWDDGQSHDMRVDYERNDDSSGNMRFGYTDDIYQPDDAEADTTEQELEKVNTRWLSTGAGRSDVTVTEGDLGENTAYVSECWDIDYLTVFSGWYYDGTGAYEGNGDEAQCVFEEPEFID